MNAVTKSCTEAMMVHCSLHISGERNRYKDKNNELLQLPKRYVKGQRDVGQ